MISEPSPLFIFFLVLSAYTFHDIGVFKDITTAKQRKRKSHAAFVAYVAILLKAACYGIFTVLLVQGYITQDLLLPFTGMIVAIAATLPVHHLYTRAEKSVLSG